MREEVKIKIPEEEVQRLGKFGNKPTERDANEVFQRLKANTNEYIQVDDLHYETSRKSGEYDKDSTSKYEKSDTGPEETGNEEDVSQISEAAPAPAPPQELLEMIEIGMYLSEPVSVGVVANYLCDKLREMDITEIGISARSDTAETEKINLDNEEEIKSHIADVVYGLSESEMVTCPIDWCSYSGGINEVLGHVMASDDHTQAGLPKIDCPVEGCNKSKASVETIAGHFFAISDGEHDTKKLLNSEAF